MSKFGTIAQLAALIGLVLSLSACHYYAPYFGPPGHAGYYDQGGRHHGDRHHGDGHRDDNRRPYRPYGY